MKRTRVVNLRREAYDVYIGLAGRGQDGTFGNPFWTGNDEVRDEVIEKFKIHFLERVKSDPDFHRKVQELKGKRLGCFCKPKRCHGDVIVDYLEGIEVAAIPKESQQLTLTGLIPSR
jgi:hypothetical protein